MSLPIRACGAAILAGGHSSRMGCCKAILKIGEETILSRLAEQLTVFDELLLSANDPALTSGGQMAVVQDIFHDIGPLGGLHACLSATEKEALLVVPCDLPRYSPEVTRLLLDSFPPERDAMICRDGTGRMHPLCGIYRKRVLPLLEAQIKFGDFRVRHFLSRLDCALLNTGGLIPDEVFFNMNTPVEYRHLLSLEGHRGDR